MSNRRPLRLPEMLRACAMAAPAALIVACPDREHSESGNETEVTVGSSSDASSSDASSSDASSSDPSASSTTGPAVDCGVIPDQDCDAHPSCAYYPEFGGCVLDCDGLDEAMCNEVVHCRWFDTVCGFEPVA